jgi:cation diffusion facilitator family transporter
VVPSIAIPGKLPQTSEVTAYEEQKRMMYFSLMTAGVLLAAKVTAAVVTGSSAIYSDAAESVVHFLAVCFAVWALHLVHKPADETHHFGHDKVSFLSAGFEGAMISAAALLIFYEAIRQMISGVEIVNLSFGVIVTAARPCCGPMACMCSRMSGRVWRCWSR